MLSALGNELGIFPLDKGAFAVLEEQTDLLKQSSLILSCQNKY